MAISQIDISVRQLIGFVLRSGDLGGSGTVLLSDPSDAAIVKTLESWRARG